MDTLGAVLGPLIALIYLFFYPENYRSLFLIAFVPGLLAVVFSLFIKEHNTPRPVQLKKNTFLSFLNYWKSSSISYKKLIIGLLVFAFFNSSDVFLILKIKQSGMSDSFAIGVYIFYNLIYAIFSYPLGILADKLGVKNIFISGLILFTVVYFGMSISSKPIHFIGLFFIYGIFGAATEGVSKAWISLNAEKKDTATAIGLYSGIQSICALIASSFTGFIWFSYGATAAFMITAVATILVILYFSIAIERK